NANWIRPASGLAAIGSQWGSRARRTPSVAATAAKSASWTIEPRRTCPANLLDRRFWRRFQPLDRGNDHYNPRRGGSSGTRSWNLSHRGRRDPRVCRACDDERSQHPHRRLDPDGRRPGRDPVVVDLLVVVGGTGVLVVAQANDLRGRRPSAVLDRRSNGKSPPMPA